MIRCTYFKLVLGVAGLLLIVPIGKAATYTANITIGLANVSSDGAPPGTNGSTGPLISSYLCQAVSCFSGNFDGAGDKVWTSNGTNRIILSPATTTILDQANPDGGNNGSTGNNGTDFYNAYDERVEGARDYSAYGQPNCTTALIVFPYSCSVFVGQTPRLFPTVVTGVGPGASASGTVTVDTVAGTLTGTLTFNPRGGAGAIAFDSRFGDGSPFNAAQDEVSTSATLQLSLVGTFTATAWTITGGQALLNDPGFRCTQGDLSATLCSTNLVIGGHRINGSHLSWINTPVYDKAETAGGTLQFTLPGVIGLATLDAAGNITGSGEGRRPAGMSTGGCPNSIAYAGTRITCGSITATPLSISGSRPIAAPPVANADSATTVVNTPVDISVLANDTGLNAVPISVSILTQASNGTAVVSGSPGFPGAILVTYTPAANVVGNDTFTYRVSNALGDSSSATVSVAIAAEAQSDNATAAVNVPIGINVLANDVGFADPVTVTLVTLPSLGTATVSGSPGPRSGITITYSSAVAGVDSFVYEVSDGTQTASAIVNLQVGGVARPDGAFAVYAVPINIDVMVNDTGFTEPVTLDIQQGPSHGIATVIGSPGIAATARVRYTGDAGYEGPDSVVYQVSDGLSTTSATVSINVAATQAVDDSYVVQRDNCQDFPVLANDLGFRDPVTVSMSTYPNRGGQVNIFAAPNPGPASSYYLRYCPPGFFADFQESFRYQVTDGVNLGRATVAIQVVEFKAQDDRATTVAGTPVVIDIGANDLGFASPATAGLYTTPTHGNAVVSGTSPSGNQLNRNLSTPGNANIVTYTPQAGFLGTDKFDYVINDGTRIGIATITVNVIHDIEGDGIADEIDNCVNVANGDQRDTNGDGYGNVCDPDFDNNGVVNINDFNRLKARLGISPIVDVDTDLDGNGVVNINDLDRLKSYLGKPPGPSGLHQ